MKKEEKTALRKEPFSSRILSVSCSSFSSSMRGLPGSFKAVETSRGIKLYVS